MQNLEATLQTKLANQTKLYLPAAGAFFFKNGTFNSNGDFLAQVLYNRTVFPGTISASASLAISSSSITSTPHPAPVPKLAPRNPLVAAQVAVTAAQAKM